ncbi:MAG: hypothetical protein IH984_14660 [Planctomycetes bacterium]|nr:hypothetical protein [Planctomycetota bacterium]
MSVELTIEPGCGCWCDLVKVAPEGAIDNKSLAQWRQQTRTELGLTTDRPIIGTGHQTMLWHPGILVKFLLVDAIASANNLATANLVVDQHVGAFGEFEVPILIKDDSLGVTSIALEKHREDVPMVRRKAFKPLENQKNLRYALPEVALGVDQIINAVSQHSDAANAALQMAGVLTELMQPWAKPMPHITASDLMGTTLARSILVAISNDAMRCIEIYNDAVLAVPEAGVSQLEISQDKIELPLWRIDEDDQRKRAYLADLQEWLACEDPQFDLLPRALFMTALVRLGMCDLFVHGTGGAIYDRAMQLWIKNWLALDVAPIAVATATLRLPLGSPLEQRMDVASAQLEARKLWHDPQLQKSNGSISSAKRDLINKIEAAPRKSPERLELFNKLQDYLSENRKVNAKEIEKSQLKVEQSIRHQAEAPIIDRRSWAFPLYPREMIDELATAVRYSVTGACPEATCCL